MLSPCAMVPDTPLIDGAPLDVEVVPLVVEVVSDDVVEVVPLVVEVVSVDVVEVVPLVVEVVSLDVVEVVPLVVEVVSVDVDEVVSVEPRFRGYNSLHFTPVGHMSV